MIASLKSGFERFRGNPSAPAIPPALLRSLGPLVVLAIGITALVLMYLWQDQASYKPVFGAREKVAANDMMAVLDAEKIGYRLHPDTGQVLVPEAQLGKVRMLLAAKGVTAKLPAGLDLMDRNDPLGVSQFVQDVRFRRGLEGELAQSIMTLDAVDSARVHLSIAKSSSFVASDGEKSSASVVLAMKPGRTLSAEQIAAMVNLVAGSVASLSPQRVSLVDQAGNLLSSRVDLTEGFDAQGGNDAARRFQDEARKNVHDLLAPVLGEDNFKLSVTAAVDNDRVEETHEKYGDDPKVTNEALRNEQDQNRMALGVPGSLSNRPVAVAAAGAASGAEGSVGHKNATSRQYAYDRSITQIKRSRGRLHKLSVAVVLNTAAAPKPETGWTPAEIANIDRLLRNGLGVDADRGDNLVVSAMPFPSRPVAGPWWQERDNIIDIGSKLVYVVGAILAFLLVVRPLMKLLTNRMLPVAPATLAVADAPALAAPVDAGASAIALPNAAQPVATGSAAMPVVPLLENYDLPPAGSPVDVMVDHLKVLASKEPERVAEVVKQWVQKNA
ncbi:flagellar basal-body MS-ring/collar protein FliF [Piscinibacter gummiphilus]|uniref:Flagellar M-ring protein n=1 Tax=Piscinibacter gummiphilus TaxID=946333 RepID=A0A1W6LAN5_9BURK|nr:flagellar basal-body MS-ring/collar protein FliF [Piscinibacter gummiphilus]ARN21280.1 flagellar MS-ring protein [Piscinibacter gummiphilus]ATU65965.1 flagellar M-ring protein FliF [Piscinibacter gummiphilus]GLS93847.1 flagellar M-ring protein [Piscinibacter gummiphilus]